MSDLNEMVRLFDEADDSAAFDGDHPILRLAIERDGLLERGKAQQSTIDSLRGEVERLEGRLKNLAYTPAVKSDLPMILSVEAANGAQWDECSNCRAELLGRLSDNGQWLECGECGATWWEGELIEPTKRALAQSNDTPDDEGGVEDDRCEVHYWLMGDGKCTCQKQDTPD